MNQSFLVTAGLLLASALAGAGVVFVADKVYWEQELKVQLAEKDQIIADLNTDLQELRTGLDALGRTNKAMRGLIDASLKDAAEVAKSNRTSVERLRAIIVRLETLSQALAAEGALP